VIGLGLLSIILNAASVLLIKNDARESVNIKAAYLHLLTDVMTSIAVVGGGLLMYYFHLFWVDPVVSLLIALYLIRASIGILKESTSILMQFTPAEIVLENVLQSITSLPEIKNAHHIHLWKLDDRRIILEAHLDFNSNITLEEAGKIIDRLEGMLYREFNIGHTTFQCEYNRDDDKSIIA